MRNINISRVRVSAEDSVVALGNAIVAGFTQRENQPQVLPTDALIQLHPSLSGNDTLPVGTEEWVDEANQKLTAKGSSPAAKLRVEGVVLHDVSALGMHSVLSAHGFSSVEVTDVNARNVHLGDE